MTLRTRFSLAPLASLAAALALMGGGGAPPAAAQTSPPSYRCLVLVPLAGDISCRATRRNAINASGQVMGNSLAPDTRKGRGRMMAVLWNPATNYAPVALGTLPGYTDSEAYDVNNWGQVVGVASISTPTSYSERGFLFLPTPAYGLPAGMNDLDALVRTLGVSNVQITGATCLNDRGQAYVAGRQTDPATGAVVRRRFLLDLGATPATIMDLGEMSPLVINNAAPETQIAGYVPTSAGSPLAIWQQDTGAQILTGLPEGKNFGAAAINEPQYDAAGYRTRGAQIIGGFQRYEDAPGFSHAFLWQDGVTTELGSLGGGRGNALALNNATQIVGDSPVTATGTQPRASLWQPEGGGAVNADGTLRGSMFDLNALSNAAALGLVLSQGSGINDGGQIAGTGMTTINKTSYSRAFLLTPR